jgi:putative ABC transport system permease protein
LPIRPLVEDEAHPGGHYGQNPGVNAFLDDLKFAWRSIRSRWGLASAVLLTLGIAVAANDPDIARVAVFYRHAIEEISRVPGVRGVATNQNLPIAGLPDEVSRTVAVDGQPAWQASERPLINVQPINPAYFDVMRAPILSGRPFTEDDREDTVKVAVVSERLAARAWPNANPIGRRVRIEGATSRFVPGAAAAEALETPWLTVVGVAGDVRHDGIVNPPGFDLYVPYTQYFAGDSYFIVRTDLPAARLATSIESAIRRVDREQSVFAIRPFSAYLDDVSWQQRLSVRLFSLFAALTPSVPALAPFVASRHPSIENS